MGEKIPIPFTREMNPDKLADRVIEFLNKKRAERGLPPIEDDESDAPAQSGNAAE